MLREGNRINRNWIFCTHSGIDAQDSSRSHTRELLPQKKESSSCRSLRSISCLRHHSNHRPQHHRHRNSHRSNQVSRNRHRYRVLSRRLLRRSSESHLSSSQRHRSAVSHEATLRLGERSCHSSSLHRLLLLAAPPRISMSSNLKVEASCPEGSLPVTRIFWQGCSPWQISNTLNLND